MSATSIKYFKGRPIGIITLLPSPLLTLQGRIDSIRSKGETTVPDARIDRLITKCSIIKEKEVLAAEELCKDARKEGIRACNILLEACEEEETSPRRTATEYAKSRLLKVGSFITDIDLVLRTRIEKTNAEAVAKILSYIKGVRYRSPDYVAKIELLDTAYEAYVAKHEREDSIIHAAVNKLLPKTDSVSTEVTSSVS